MRACSILIPALLAAIGCTPVDAPTAAQKSEAPPVTVAPPTPPPTPSEPTVTCLARYALSSHDSVLDEQRRRGGGQRWNDFATRYLAATIDPATHHAVEVVSSYRVADQPILYFTPDFAEAVVDATLLGELKVVDATRLREGERVELATLTERGRAQLGGRALTDFLLKSGAVQTFIHIGSSLCLIAETQDSGGYRAELSGEHEYYTNEENHDPLAFVLEIAADGRVTVTGTRPTQIPAADAGHP